MAPSHVPGDHLPLQGQSNIYNDPAFESLFDQFGSQPWNSTPLNHAHHPGLVSNTPPTPSWQHNAFSQQPYNPSSQHYASHDHNFQSASPYQYGQFGNHGALPGYNGPSNVDPSLGVDPVNIRQQQQSPYQMPMRNPTPQGQNTVTPQALQHGPSTPLQNARANPSPYQIPKSTTEMFSQRQTPATITKPVKNPDYELPTGKKSGGFYVYDQAALVQATKSIPLNKLVTFGSEPLHLTTNRTALPMYTARQSVKDLKKAGADNKKLAKKAVFAKASRNIEGAFRGGFAKRASSQVKKEETDSDSYTDSSDDDSDYTDDEEVETSPLPNARPEEPHEAVRYDVIKSTWFPRRTQPNPEKIKDSMRDLWEILNTIHKRWRTDSKAVTEAEDQKKTGELPVLKSRVTSQRDLLQSALKASLEFAHPDVLYHLGQVKPFLYLCYQFLANRFKMHDWDGALSSAIYEILTRCMGTLTTELLEETKVIKALNSMKKSANNANKALIQQIIDGAAAGSKKPKAGSPPSVESAESKAAKKPATQPANRPGGEAPAAKKVKPAEATTNGPKKNVTATASSIAKGAQNTGTATQKRPAEKATTTHAPAKGRVNQVANKPSSFFSSLNAASKKPTTNAASSANTKATAQKSATPAVKDKKPAPATKPGFSFAETMASLLKPKEEQTTPSKPEKQLPPETAEEKARRLRKESRRHLRVTFKPDNSLVSVRYFRHEPEEDMGHEENFVRDAGDIGGEGRMFKQHKEMMDEDDEDEEAEQEYRPWKEPSAIDFSVVPLDERQRNYEPYGGGECKPSCPEREANMRHESSTLSVYYTHPSDIPSSPREPLEQQTQQSTATEVVYNFGTPPDFVQSRCPQASAPAAAPDISQLEKLFKQYSAATANASQPSASQSTYAPHQPTAAPAPPAPTADIASILSALQTQAPPPLPGQGPAQPAQPAAPQAPAIDLNAIMAAIQGSGNNNVNIPPPPSFPLGIPFPQAPQPQGNGGYQGQQQNSFDHMNSERKRRLEEANASENDHNSSKRHKAKHGNRPHKVMPCKFWKKGLCSKGDDCTYIHDNN